MAIPTNGLTAATAYAPSTTWNASITLIGDSENMIGENSSGETATLNRHVKQIAQNAKFLYEIQNHLVQTSSISDPTQFSDALDLLVARKLRYKITYQLIANLTLSNLADVYFHIERVSSAAEIIIDLNGKTINVNAGISVRPNLFHFDHVSAPLIKIHNGTINENSGNINAELIYFENCSGSCVADSLTITGSGTCELITYSSSRGTASDNELNSGTNGLVATDASHVFSKDNSSSVTNSAYGTVSTRGSVIGVYDATAPTGTSGDTAAAFGGIIN